MTKLTFEEMTAAMVILQLTHNNSNLALADVNDMLKSDNHDIDMDKVCHWLEEHDYASVDYEHHGMNCIISSGASLNASAKILFEKEY